MKDNTFHDDLLRERPLWRDAGGLICALFPTFVAILIHLALDPQGYWQELAYWSVALYFGGELQCELLGDWWEGVNRR